MGCPAIDIANPKGASRAIPAPARRASARAPVSLRRTKEKPRRYGWAASSGSYVGGDPINQIDPTGKEAATLTLAAACNEGDCAPFRTGEGAWPTWYTAATMAGASLLVPGPEDLLAAGLASKALQGPLARAIAARSGVQFGTNLQRVTSAMSRVENIIKVNAKRSDFLGVIRERRGISTGYDHITEMRNSVRGLEKATQRLEEGLESGRLTSEQAEAVKAARDAAQRTMEAMRNVLQ